MEKRFWEIDFLRGIAVILMVVFHALFDLNYFTALSLDFGSLFWFWFPRAIAAIFILLVGVSLTISNGRGVQSSPRKFVGRGLKIFAYGLAITLVTGLLFPKEFIVFGILHFIGLAIILAIPFLKWNWRNVGIALPVIALGIWLQGIFFDFSWLIWLGIKEAGFFTFDYFPLLPWFGFVLIGIFAGNKLYPNAKRGFGITELGEKPVVKQLSFLGRHSLKIYFLHQPILIVIILLLSLGIN